MPFPIQIEPTKDVEIHIFSVLMIIYLGRTSTSPACSQPPETKSCQAHAMAAAPAPQIPRRQVQSKLRAKVRKAGIAGPQVNSRHFERVITFVNIRIRVFLITSSQLLTQSSIFSTFKSTDPYTVTSCRWPQRDGIRRTRTPASAGCNKWRVGCWSRRGGHAATHRFRGGRKRSNWDF